MISNYGMTKTTDVIFLFSPPPSLASTLQLGCTTVQFVVSYCVVYLPHRYQDYFTIDFTTLEDLATILPFYLTSLVRCHPQPALLPLVKDPQVCLLLDCLVCQLILVCWVLGSLAVNRNTQNSPGEILQNLHKIIQLHVHCSTDDYFELSDFFFWS